MPVTSNWWNSMAEKNWRGKFFAKTFGTFYQDLIGPYFENVEGYNVIAGNRNMKTGRRSRPAIYDYGKKKSYGNFDYLLEKNGKYYVAATKYWPNFDNKYMKSTPNAVKKAYPFFYSFNPKRYWAKVGSKYYPIHGKVLFWWDTSSISELKKNGFYAVYSIHNAIYRMANRTTPAYNNWYRHYKSWFNDFFGMFQPKASSYKTTTRRTTKTTRKASRPKLRVAKTSRRRTTRAKRPVKKSYRTTRRVAA
jgi:hypothetical protein